MNISVTDSERELLLEVLEARYTSMLHELHHTDTHDYKQLLKGKLELLEKLKDQLQHTSNEQS
jgi:TnpA family transposase